MTTLPFFIAWRFLWAAQQEKTINTMVKICLISIVIATFSLTLVLAIMRGFEKTTHEKIQGIQPQITMQAEEQHLDISKIIPILKNEFPKIIGISPRDTQYVIVQNPRSQEINKLIVLRGINPTREAQTTTLETKIIEAPMHTLSSIIHDNTILIGEKFADTLNVLVGDQFEIAYVPEQQPVRNKITLDKTTVTIGGIFKTGIDEFDSSLMFCSLQFLHKLFPNSGITSIGLKTKPHVNEKDIIRSLQKRFNLSVYSWKEAYPALVAALKLEKYASFFILALIVLVASMSIMSLLFMQITQKRPDIAILQSMGMSNKDIRYIFLFIGLLLTFLGAGTGLLLALLVGIILQQYPFIELPDIYYVTHLPISLEPHIFLIVFVIVIFLSLFAILLPLRNIKQISIAHVLRYGG